MKNLIIAITLILFASFQTFSQCNQTFCSGSSGDVTKSASALGVGTTAAGWGSFAGGYYSHAKKNFSFAFGFQAIANDEYSIAIGRDLLSFFPYSVTMGKFLESRGSSAFVFGEGFDDSNRLINGDAYTMMIGFKSSAPTLFIGKSLTNNTYKDRTGRVAIGNMTDPEAKLHIYADDNEDATLLLEPSGWAAGKIAKLMLGDTSYWLKTGSSGGFQFNSTDDFTMRVNYETKMLVTSNGIDVRGKTITETFRLFNSASPPQSGYVLQTDALGNGRWQEADFSKWDDQPGANGIMYDGGSVGIGTDETAEYMLAVNGKILTTEVTVKLRSDWGWPDYVFAGDYQLKNLGELKDFIGQNKHLPDVPSAEDVKANGVDLGRMNAVLLKKVEELTLYLIEQQEMIEQQQAQIDELVEVVRK